MLNYNIYLVCPSENDPFFQRAIKGLQQSHIPESRVKMFRALDPKECVPHHLAPRMTTYCSLLCPTNQAMDSLSHLELASFLYEEDQNPFAMVINADAYPLFFDLDKAVNDQIFSISPNWDIMRLTDSPKKRKQRRTMSFLERMTTSDTAAYLISKNGQKKLSTTKCKYRYDIQLNNTKNLNVISSFIPLFRVGDNLPTKNTTEAFTKALEKSIVKVPIVNYEVTSAQSCLIIALIICTLCYLIIKSQYTRA